MVLLKLHGKTDFRENLVVSPMPAVIMVVIAFVTALKNAALPGGCDIQQVAEFLKHRCFICFFLFS